MKASTRWSIVFVLGLLFIAACGGEKTEPVDLPQPRAAITIDVTISDDGLFDPSQIAPNPGDTVAFLADGVDVVLCVNTDVLFGDTRYPIANGATASLVVQPEAEHIEFAYSSVIGDLTATCDGAKGGEGGGTSGP